MLRQRLLALLLLASLGPAPAFAGSGDGCVFTPETMLDCITASFDRRVAPVLLTGGLSTTNSWDFHGLIEGFGSYLAHADFNNDGLLDTVVSGYQGTAALSQNPGFTKVFSLPGAMYIFYAKAGGGYQPYFTPLRGQFDFIWFGAAFAPVDFNGDGQMDLIVTAPRAPHPSHSSVLAIQLDGDDNPPEDGPWYRASLPADPFFGFSACATTLRTPLSPTGSPPGLGEAAVVANLGGNDRVLFFTGKRAVDPEAGFPNQGGICACPFRVGEAFADRCIEIRHADIQTPQAFVSLFGSSLDVWDRDGDGIDDVIVVGAEDAVKPGTNIPTGAVFIADFAVDLENDAIAFSHTNIVYSPATELGLGGDDARENFGFRSAFVPDLDGNGQADLLVTAPDAYVSPKLKTSAVYVYYLGADNSALGYQRLTDFGQETAQPYPEVLRAVAFRDVTPEGSVRFDVGITNGRLFASCENGVPAGCGIIDGVEGYVITVSTPEKAPQTIAFGPNPGPLVFGDATPAFVSATASSGLPVLFGSATPAICSVDVDSGELAMLAAGDCAITADQPGDFVFLPAPQETQTVVIEKAAQSISFGANPGPLVFAGTSASVTATATSGLAVSFASNTPAFCSVNASSGLIEILGAGNCEITANQPGNGNYHPAPQATQTVVIQRAEQIITFGPNPGPLFVGQTGAFVSATNSSGMPLSFFSDHPEICEVDADTGDLTPLMVGDCEIIAFHDGNENYYGNGLTQNIAVLEPPIFSDGFDG